MLEKTATYNNRLLAEHLTEVLADSYLVYNTTQFCHWNVVGGQFKALHDLFEEQYRSLAEAIDMIAERVSFLGFYTPGTLAELTQLSALTQKPGLRETDAMLDHLIEGHTAVANRLLETVKVANEAGDEATQDMAIERLRAHEKAAWILKSQAGKAFEDLKTARQVQQLANEPGAV